MKIPASLYEWLYFLYCTHQRKRFFNILNRLSSKERHLVIKEILKRCPSPENEAELLKNFSELDTELYGITHITRDLLFSFFQILNTFSFTKKHYIEFGKKLAELLNAKLITILVLQEKREWEMVFNSSERLSIIFEIVELYEAKKKKLFTYRDFLIICFVLSGWKMLIVLEHPLAPKLLPYLNILYPGISIYFRHRYTLLKVPLSPLVALLEDDGPVVVILSDNQEKNRFFIKYVEKYTGKPVKLLYLKDLKQVAAELRRDKHSLILLEGLEELGDLEQKRVWGYLNRVNERKILVLIKSEDRGKMNSVIPIRDRGIMINKLFENENYKKLLYLLAERLSDQTGKPFRDFDAFEKWEKLKVDELPEKVDLALLQSQNGLLKIEDIEIFERIKENPYNLKLHIEVLEKALLKKALQSTKGNILKAAKLLGISRMKLYSMIKKYGFEREIDEKTNRNNC